jgi:hypothetical protein
MHNEDMRMQRRNRGCHGMPGCHPIARPLFSSRAAGVPFASSRATGAKVQKKIYEVFLNILTIIEHNGLLSLFGAIPLTTAWLGILVLPSKLNTESNVQWSA